MLERLRLVSMSRRNRPLGLMWVQNSGDSPPLFPGKTNLDWKLDDPAGQGIDAVRRPELTRIAWMNSWV
jgi:hypothetical protein